MDKNKLHLEHIIWCITNIKDFTKDIDSFDDFVNDLKTIRAIERELETMTQSIKDLWDEVYKISSKLDWKSISWMRDILAHHYLVLADSIIWDIVQNKLPELEKEFRMYMKI